jgi:GNAT superfamily N-acetyltransferase
MTAAYRDAAPRDMAVIDRLFRASFCDTFGHLYRPADLAAFLAGFTGEAWSAELTDPAYAFRLVEVAGEAAGFVKLGPLGVPVDTDVPAMELKQFYVLKEHHGKGLGPPLMEWALDEARRRGMRELYLSVYTDNRRARRFYAGFGFEDVGTWHFMVGSQPDNDFIMRKAV